jgi:exodeoxyribonuclease V alpha subunit
MIVEEAISRYKRGQDVRVLTYFRRDVWTINKGIQSVINPCVPGKQTLYRCGDENDQEFTFVDGDYVVFKKNSDKKGYYNGQAGILHIRNDQSYYVKISNGCNIDFPSDCPPNMLLPAYATTIHRAQGGQFDSVLLYIPYSGKTLNNRNTIYTGISRAKQELVLYSSKGAVSFGLQQTAPTRNSTLVAKTYSQFFAA